MSQLPVYDGAREERDWLIARSSMRSGVFRSADGNEIILANGLLKRSFWVSGGFATISFENLRTGEQLCRAASPEGWVEIGGKRVAIGGMSGQPNLAFLKRDWLNQMKPTDGAFRYTGYELRPIEERMPWVRRRVGSETQWPPHGVGVVFHFSHPNGLIADVHYEMYDGVPVLSKWIEFRNDSSATVTIEKFSIERFSAVESESVVDTPGSWMRPHLKAMTDYSFGGMSETASNRTVNWVTDPGYGTQVNYELKTPCVLEISSPVGPSVELSAGEKLRTFRAFEFLYDDNDRERCGLVMRSVFRLLAPWCMENPIMLHLTSTDPDTVKRAIDQAAECGFEMIVISFWSGLDMEDLSDANIAKFKGFVDYAHSKGLQLGGYSLLASRRIDDENDVINPKTGKTGGAIFGNSPCLSSKWGLEYFQKLKKFIDATGFDLLEHDGNYPGDVCASTKHPAHKGLEDSQWKQYAQISEFYKWCRAKGVFLNVPDNYFFAGSNKTGMGYRESNWSLPREQQHIHARQNLFDGTWEKTPSMGWMMVPLVEYQGGGAAATIEPLKDHLVDYEQHLANNFGFGAQACYRGPRVYDTPETKAVVVKWVNWFKKYREILESDVVHIRRADGVNLDSVLHVNPFGEIRGMLLVYNPSDKPMTQQISVPLYYTGLRGSFSFSLEGKAARRMKTDDLGRASIEVTVAPYSRTWAVIKK
ncbi:MAG: hypothetical protein U0R49_09100 [Fimbriimonadales bacterium]